MAAPSHEHEAPPSPGSIDLDSFAPAHVLQSLMDGSLYMPHGHCYLWQKPLLALHVASDVLIGAAYFFISLTLYFLVRRIRLPFGGMFIAFGVFIGACGLTHFMEVWNVWNSAFWLSGGVKLVTAAASVITGVYLVPLRGKVADVASAARLSEERRLQLETKNLELEALYAKLKEGEELRSRFFANVSHELRTPLALILGPAEKLLQDADRTPAQRPYLETVARNARLLLKQVNDLLDVSKLEAGKMDLHYTNTDLARLVRVTASHFASMAQERGVTQEIHTPDTLFADVDPEKLERVLLNLLSNAYKFVPGHGRIRVELRQENGAAVLVVEDDGPGVPPDFRDKIFDRFQQADGGLTRRVGGTGLGLAIVKEFVELHAGSARVEQAEPQGARFVITLPISAPRGAAVQEALVPGNAEPENQAARLSLEELRTPSTNASAHGRPQDSGKKLRALVVEDNPEMRRFVTESLETQFHVVTAANGREGLEAARAGQPDVVVSDLMMPEMSGDALAREMRREEALRNTPVLLLTAKADPSTRVELLREGVQDFLTKPFRAEELIARAWNLAQVKRAREILQEEASASERDMLALAERVTQGKRQLEAALQATSLAREHAEKASLAKSTFLRMMSHEFRTPLTALSLQLASLAKRGVDDAATDRLQRSLQRLQNLVESILEYTRVESGVLVARFEQVELRAVAQDVVHELLPSAQERLLRLSLSPDGALPPIRTDPRLLHIVLVNLVMNAIKYTQQGFVEVTVFACSGGQCVSVRDSGPGIPEEARSRIFEPFEQLESINRKHVPGVGLGLALVREIVQVLRGRVDLHSELGKGSEFRVLLPESPEET